METSAHARAGLLGNPSDGYFGKVIAVCVRNFAATVSLRESRRLRIRESGSDAPVYRDVADLHDQIELYGYYGGVRLVKAAVKKFVEYCRAKGIDLPRRNFTLEYGSDIPRQLGMGGSSAIVTAALRALMRFFEVKIPIEKQPTLILEAERDELGINAGFMDRVIQVYEGCVFMDLARKGIEARGHGEYRRLNAARLPDLYLAYRVDLGKVSGRVLNRIRIGWENRDPLVLETLERIASIAQEGRDALEGGDPGRLIPLMNENFDLRSRIMTISRGDRQMIEAARGCGASAKFAGSGGTIIGIFQGEEMYRRVREALTRLGATVIRPEIE